jgi:hypothetical protein
MPDEQPPATIPLTFRFWRFTVQVLAHLLCLAYRRIIARIDIEPELRALTNQAFTTTVAIAIARPLHILNLLMRDKAQDDAMTNPQVMAVKKGWDEIKH